MRNLIIAFLFIFTCLPAFSQPTELTLDQAVQLAAENNLNLKQEAVEIKTLKRQTIAAFNSLIPEVSGTASLARPNTPRNPMTGQEIDPYWGISLDLSAQLVINPAMFMAIKNTRLNLARGKISYEAARKSLERDIKKNYFSLLLMEENIALAESNLQTAERRYEREQNNYSYGSSSQLNLLKMQVAYENLKPVLSGLKSDYAQAMYMFKVTLGIDADTQLVLVTAIPDSDKFTGSEAVPAIDPYDSISVRELQAALIHLRHTKQTTKAAYFSPSLIIGASLNPVISRISDDTVWTGEDNSWTDEGMLTLSVSVPVDALIPVSKENVKIREMNDSIESMQLQLEQVEKMTSVEIKTLIMKLDKALGAINAYELNAELAGKVMDLTESAFESGAVGFLDVEDAVSQYNQAKLALLSGKLDYITTALDLEYSADVTILGENDE